VRLLRRVTMEHPSRTTPQPTAQQSSGSQVPGLQVGPGVIPWALSGRPDFMMPAAYQQVATPAMMQIPSMGFPGQYMITQMPMMASQIVPVGGQPHPSQHASQFVSMQQLPHMAAAMSSASGNNGGKAPQASAFPVGNGSVISWGSSTNGESARACDHQSLTASQRGAMAAATVPQLTTPQFQQAFSSFSSAVPAQTYQLAPTAQLPLNVDVMPLMSRTSASAQPTGTSVSSGGSSVRSASSPFGLASLALAGEVLQGDNPAPRPRKTEVPAARLRKVLLFIQQMGRRPTRKSRDPAEKTLGIWLHRFICNDDGVKDRAQNAMPPHEFDFIMQTIESAPDAKQVADKQVALSNVEAIAQRALSLQAVPLRGDASGCGKKLHNIRQGRLGPGLRDEALAIVRRILGGDPNCATVLAHLEASIELSSARHADYMARTRMIAVQIDS